MLRINQRLANQIVLVSAVLLLGCGSRNQEVRRDLANGDANWALVWEDDFDGTALDTMRWRAVTGDGCDVGICGWGNDELEWYAPENVTVADGILRLTARREIKGGKNFTSGKIETRSKADWRYGRFEVRARLPRGRGFWPAIWLLPTHNTYGGWAASGEIDIMEAIGREPARIYTALHHGGAWPNNVGTVDSLSLTTNAAYDDFHTYGLVWSEDRFQWYFDGEIHAVQTEWSTSGHPYPAPFDQQFFLILNVAVGGKWPGSPDATTEFPKAMEVDFVRVYQRAAE